MAVREKEGLPKLVVQAVSGDPDARGEYHALTAEEKAELVENVNAIQVESTTRRTTRQVQADINSTCKHIIAEVSSALNSTLICTYLGVAGHRVTVEDRLRDGHILF